MGRRKPAIISQQRFDEGMTANILMITKNTAGTIENIGCQDLEMESST